MISKEEAKKIDKGMLPLTIIWGAILFSLFVYMFIAPYVSNNADLGMYKDLVGLLRNILYAVSLVILISTRFVRKLALSGKIANNVRPMNPGTYRANQSVALARYTSAMVTSLAMTESIGIFGLVLFVIGENPMDLYSFILVSAVTMLFYRPKKEEIINLAEELEKKTADAH